MYHLFKNLLLKTHFNYLEQWSPTVLALGIQCHRKQDFHRCSEKGVAGGGPDGI